MITSILFDFSRVILFPKDPNFHGSLNQLYEDCYKNFDYSFDKYFLINYELLILCRRLKNKYSLNIFTTEKIQTLPEVQKYTDGIFEHIYTTSEVGVNKNDPRSYIFIADENKVESTNVIFIDDQSENIQAAKIAGYNVIQYLDNVDLLAKLSYYIDLDNLGPEII